ncbi:MAG: carbonic anhydrase [Brachymonas sp.]|jgi:carbonic anhydrase
MMKNNLRLLTTLLLAASVSVAAAEHGAHTPPHWAYEGQASPEHWGQLSPDFTLCAIGKNQSPINIQGALKAQQSKLLLHFEQAQQNIVHNGHTVQIDVAPGNTLDLGQERFSLQQFHFHAPSENTIDGQQFPLEGHFVYKNQEGGLAVVALMFQEGQANPELAKAWQHMPSQHHRAATLKRPVDIQALLPEQYAFYRFSGSLTTPPCSEGVVWLVLTQTASASAAQIQQLRSALRHTNNRPLQPLNGRVIVN